MGAPADQGASLESVFACILAHNDATRIAGIVRLAVSYCGSVIVCDDGSTDGTSAEAMKAGARVIRHETRLGRAKCMADLVNEVILKSPSGVVFVEREGFGFAGGIPALLEPVLNDQADVSVGIVAKRGSEGADGSLKAMNSKGMLRLYGEGYFSEAGSPRSADVVAAGLRVRAVPLRKGAASLAVAVEPAPTSAGRHGGLNRIPRFIIIRRPFLMIGLPSIVFTISGMYLLAMALINYSYTGQIPVRQGVMGAVGLTSILLGLALMISYVVAYAVKHASEAED